MTIAASAAALLMPHGDEADRVLKHTRLTDIRSREHPNTAS
jgi:hypothetical protein